jgi:hypothetical protein
MLAVTPGKHFRWPLSGNPTVNPRRCGLYRPTLIIINKVIEKGV